MPHFPDPWAADPNGIVAFGMDLEPETLLEAYRNGAFPWPIPGLPLPWFSPDPRAILEFHRIHVPRSLRQARKSAKLSLTVDRDFAGVMEGCAAAPRPGPPGTWITAEMIRAYVRLHRLGHAHSAEAWEAGRLVGGVYGVLVDGSFSAESMFYRVPNASKLALLHLVDRLRDRGLTWMDIQTLSPHMQRLGARQVPREEFLRLLAASRARAGASPLVRGPENP